jgi:hypothetical protein
LVGWSASAPKSSVDTIASFIAYAGVRIDYDLQLRQSGILAWIELA